MKKLFASVCFIVLFNVSFGQIEQGNWLVGGSGSFNTGTDSVSNYQNPSISNQVKVKNNINISSDIGYFFINKLAGGIKLNFSSKYAVYNPNSYERGGFLTVGPFIRYYFLNQDKEYNILLESSYTIGNSLFSPKEIVKELNFFAGPELFLNSVIGIEFLIGYNNNVDSRFDYNSNLIYKRVQNYFQINIGLQIYLIKN
ncbi:MAG: hypothetical protein KGO81_12960 [Bacteroidota bacterium]|nr:hypothetical protein [Bacteroidota bacterium]